MGTDDGRLGPAGRRRHHRLAARPGRAGLQPAVEPPDAGYHDPLPEGDLYDAALAAAQQAEAWLDLGAPRDLHLALRDIRLWRYLIQQMTSAPPAPATADRTGTGAAPASPALSQLLGDQTYQRLLHEARSRYTPPGQVLPGQSALPAQARDPLVALLAYLDEIARRGDTSNGPAELQLAGQGPDPRADQLTSLARQAIAYLDHQPAGTVTHTLFAPAPRNDGQLTEDDIRDLVTSYLQLPAPSAPPAATTPAGNAASAACPAAAGW